MSVVKDKFEHYSAAEREGRLIELPCKLGTKYYRILHKKSSKGKVFWYIKASNLSFYTLEGFLRDYGKTVFLKYTDASEVMNRLKVNEESIVASVCSEIREHLNDGYTETAANIQPDGMHIPQSDMLNNPNLDHDGYRQVEVCVDDLFEENLEDECKWKNPFYYIRLLSSQEEYSLDNNFNLLTEDTVTTLEDILDEKNKHLEEIIKELLLENERTPLKGERFEAWPMFPDGGEPTDFVIYDRFHCCFCTDNDDELITFSDEKLAKSVARGFNESDKEVPKCVSI